MRRRWRYLFLSSLAATICVAWLIIPASISLAIEFETLGLLATVIIAFAGMVTSTRKRWPAACALLGAAPLGYETVKALPDVLSYFQYLSPLLVLTYVAFLAMIVSACHLLFRPLPPVPADVIPPAQLMRDRV
jgi:hypothetical protein